MLAWVVLYVVASAVITFLINNKDIGDVSVGSYWKGEVVRDFAGEEGYEEFVDLVLRNSDRSAGFVVVLIHLLAGWLILPIKVYKTLK